MIEHRLDASASYQTFVAIWASVVVAQLLLLLFIYLTRPELLAFDLTQPILGEDWIFILVIAFLSVISLVYSITRPTKLLKESAEKQKPDLVQIALIVGVAQAMCISLWGLFLAFAFDYQYFFVWMLVGFVATCLNFPRRRDLENASRKTL